MNAESIFSIIIIALMITALTLEVFPTAIILAGALLVFLFSGIVSPQEALSGLSNQGMIIVAMLFIVAAAIQNTGALHRIAFSFSGKKGKSGSVQSLFRMMVPVSALSAFMNNTPIVVLFTPVIKRWAERLEFNPSKFLIPLSYAAIFGGMCTLIGTSTNLIVHGMMLQNNVGEISMFELAKVGVPCTLIGWVYLAFFGQKLLPERRDILDDVKENRKEYVVGMRVTNESPIIGKTIKEAGLRNLKNVYLLEIERAGKTFGPVSPEERIADDDILYFVGVSSAIADLQEIPGIVPAAHKVVEKDFLQGSAHFIEAVVSDSAPILGETVKEADFRSRYGAGVIAIHRNGERIKSKIGDIRLRIGDVLLLLARDSFLKDWGGHDDFYLISKVGFREKKSKHKIYLAVGILALMVLVTTFKNFLPAIGGNKISMFYASSAAAALMILTKCVKIEQAKDSLKLNVLLTIACALGISKALDNSGAAHDVAGFLINLVKGLGPLGTLGAIYFLTIVFTEIITNYAAVALVFPIAYSASMQLGVSPKPFFIAIAIAASATFVTPIGHQTNLVVQGAGGYKFRDYFKVGLPLNILFFVLALTLIPLFWKF